MNHLYETTRYVAFHEAGHTVAMLAQGHKVTKVRVHVSPGLFGPSVEGWTGLHNEENLPLKDDMIITAAGQVAEELLYEEWGDVGGARSQAKAHAAGDSEIMAELAVQTSYKPAQAHRDARKLLMAHWRRVERVAEELARKGDVTGHRLARLT